MAEAVAGFDWDEGNREKCAKHGVSIEAIEDLFRRPVVILPDAAHSQVEPRHRAIGLTSGQRHLFVAFTIRERDGIKLIRPISARYMHRKEIKSYEEENPDISL